MFSKINPSRVLQPVAEALRQSHGMYGVHSGAAATAAIATGLAAPMFMSDDDRGYFRTSLVTTPVIGSAYIMGPHLKRGASNLFSRGAEFHAAGGFQGIWENNPESIKRGLGVESKYYRESSFTAFNQAVEERLRNALKTNQSEAIKRAASQREEMWQLFAAHESRIQKLQTFAGRKKGVFKQLAESAIQSRRQLLTNAVNRAYLNNINYTEYNLEQVKQLRDPANTLFEWHGFDVLKTRMAAKEANQQFLREITNGLMRAQKLKLGKVWSEGAVVQAAQAKKIRLSPKQLKNFSDQVSSETFRLMMELGKKGNLKNAWVRNGRVVGAELSFLQNDEKVIKLNVPIVSDNSGMVYFGEEMDRVGIARGVFFDDGSGLRRYNVDEHLLELAVRSNGSAEQLAEMKEDMARIVSFSGYEVGEEAAGLDQTAALDKGMIKRKSLSDVPSNMRPFKDPFESNEQRQMKKWHQLSHGAKEQYEQKLRQAGYGSFGSESAFSKGVHQRREAERMLPFGITQHTKQSWWDRQMKEARLDPATIQSAVERGDFRRFQVSSSGIEELGQGAVPAVESYIAAIDTDAAAYFSGLPDDLAKVAKRDRRAAIEELHEYTRQFLASDPARAARREQIQKMTEFLEARTGEELSDYLQVSRKLKGMGEGGYILDAKYGQLRLTQKKNYLVDVLTLPEHLKSGDEFGSDIVLGLRRHNEITAKSERSVLNKIRKINRKNSKGATETKYLVETTAVQDIGVGAKPDTYLGKGQVNAVLDGGERQKFRELLKLFTGSQLPENSSAYMLRHYGHADAKLTPELVLSQAAGLLGELRSDTIGAYQEEQAAFLNTLARNNFGLDEEGRIIDRGAAGTTEELGQRAEDVSLAARKFVIDVGRKYAPESMRPATVRAWHESKLLGGVAGNDLFDYMHKNAMYSPMAFWTSSEKNLATETKMTFDLFGQLFQAGHLPVMEELFERADFYRGDPVLAREFMTTMAEADLGKKPFGRSFQLSDLPRDLKRADHIDLAALALDERFAENFSIELPRAVQVQIGSNRRTIKHLPVLGHKALKGSPNYYDLGEMSFTDSQRALQHALAAKTDEELAEAISNKTGKGYFDLLASEMMGKKGIFRPDMRDPMASEGFLITRRSTFVKGGRFVENPFDVLVNKKVAQEMVGHFTLEAAESMGFDNIAAYRKAFLRGQADSFSVMFRHPISAAPLMRVRYKPDAGLTTGQIGISEAMRSVFKSDDDLDPTYLVPVRRKASIEHAKQIMSDVENMSALKSIDDLKNVNPQVAQWKLVNMLYGRSEDTANLTTSFVMDAYKKDPAQAIQEMIRGAMANEDAVSKIMQNKLAGSYIGQFSNMLTTLQIGLESHPTLATDHVNRSILNELFFNMRQVPISAQKSKMVLEGGAQGWIDQVKRGLLDRENGHLLLQDAMVKFAQGAKFETRLDQETMQAFNLDSARFESKIGSKVNLFEEIAKSERIRDLLKEYVSKRPAEVDSLAKLMTSEGKFLNTAKIFEHYRSTGKILPYARVGESSASNAMSRTLGSINEAIKSAIPRVQEIMKTAAPMALAGLGAAAAVGFLTTPTKSEAPMPQVPQPKAALRPEDMGTSDRVPGEPVAGSESSVHPKRETTPPRAQTRTSVVAPMRRSMNVDVRGRAVDRSAGANMARLVEQFSGSRGHTNITVTNSGGYRDGVSRHVQRQRVREELDRHSRY